MTTRLFALLSAGAIATCLVTGVSAIENPYESGSNFSIKNPTVEQIEATTTIEELDALLYPHGLQLPTKYIDASMLYLGDTVSTATDAVLYFADTYCQYNDISYTNAEVMAMRLWVTMGYLDETSEAYEAFADFYDRNGIDVSSFRGTLGPTNFEKTKELVLSAQQTGGDLMRSTDGSVGSLGCFTPLDYLDSGEDIGVTVDDLPDYWRSRVELIDLLGLQAKDNGVAQDPCVWETSEYMQWLTANSTDEDEDAATEEPVEEAPPTTDDKPAIDPDSEIGKPMKDHKPNEYVADFETGIGSDDVVVHRTYGVQDVLLYVSVVLVISIATVFGILDWRRKRKDPTKNYPKWR